MRCYRPSITIFLCCWMMILWNSCSPLTSHVLTSGSRSFRIKRISRFTTIHHHGSCTRRFASGTECVVIPKVRKADQLRYENTTMKPTEYTDAIEAYVAHHMSNNLRIICNTSNLLLSVSGGSDSIAMFHIMQRVKEKFFPSLKLSVVHFNHKKRIESDEEVNTIELVFLYYLFIF